MNESIEAIATRFVNLSEATVKDFARDYKKELRPYYVDKLEWPPHIPKSKRPAGLSFNEYQLYRLAVCLREAWDKANWSTAEMNLEQIFGSFLVENVRRQMRGLKRGEMRSQPYPDDQTPFERAAFQIRLGESRPVFKSRGLLDDIAHAILKASARGLLRTCRGHQRGWDCPTPLLVADEKRRVYCYMRCGDHSKSLSRLRWWRENRSASAKARQKSNLRASSRRGKAA